MPAAEVLGLVSGWKKALFIRSSRLDGEELRDEQAKSPAMPHQKVQCTYSAAQKKIQRRLFKQKGLMSKSSSRTPLQTTCQKTV
jgi:hypothetical protein